MMKSLLKLSLNLIIILTISGCSKDAALPSAKTNMFSKQISNNGSSRATAYNDSNKIIETSDWIFYSWLDFEDGSFAVKVGHLNKKNEEIIHETKVDTEVFDNHGGPALVIDNRGYLHIFYGPHNGPMIYRKSSNPYDISEWTEKEYIGEELTYPSVCVDSNNTIYLVARHRVPYGPWSLQFFKKNESSNWSQPVDILVSNYDMWQKNGLELTRNGGYVRWGKTLHIDPNGKTLHLAFKIDEALPKNLDAEYQRSNGLGSYLVGYMNSDTGGKTWTANNSTLELPATPQKIEIIAGNSEPVKNGPHYEVSNLSFDSFGNPNAIVIEQYEEITKLSITKRINGLWERHDFNIEGNDRIVSPVSFFIDDSGHYYGLFSTIEQQLYSGSGGWYAQSFNNIELYKSNNGSNYNKIPLFNSDTSNLRPAWFPSVNYTQNHVKAPIFMYTTGTANLRSSEESPNTVYLMKPSMD